MTDGSRKSVSAIFGQGLVIITGCPWLLALPLTAEILVSAVSLPGMLTLLKNSHSTGSVIVWGTGPFFFARFSVDIVLGSLVNGMSGLNTAMVSPFKSVLAVGICLLVATAALLRGHPAALSVVGINQERRLRLGLALGVAGIAFLLTYYRIQTFGAENWMRFSWLPFLLSLLVLPVEVYVLGMLLVMMEATFKGTRLTLAETTFRARLHFKALLLFRLVIIGIGVAVPLLYLALEGLFPSSNGQSAVVYYVLRLAVVVPPIISATIAFVPVLIVVNSRTISEGFKDCFALWTRHPKSAAMFLTATIFLLALPTLLRVKAQGLFEPGQTAGYIIAVQLLHVGIGVYVMSSMVVFCLKRKDIAGVEKH